MPHQAFGLHWHSPDLDLPELPPAGPPVTPPPSVWIVQDDPSQWWRLPRPTEIEPGLGIEPGLLQLEVEGVGRFRVTAGHRLAWTRWHADVPDRILRSYLLGSGVGAVLIQRGLLVLHGNALEREGRAVVCVGESGAGKSTFACALMRHGWKLLADDLVAITPDGQVLPGIPRIKLWEDAALAFGLDPLALPEIHTDRGRRKVVLMGEAIDRAAAPAALGALCLLAPRSGSAIAIRPIHSQKERVMALQRQAFRPAFVRALGREGANFLAISALQRHVPVLGLSLPSGIGSLMVALGRSDDLLRPSHLEALGSASSPAS